MLEEFWDFVGDRSSQPATADDPMKRFMTKLDLNDVLRSRGATRGLTNAERAEILGCDVEEIEKRDAERKTRFANKAPLTSIIAPDLVAKCGLNKAAGYLDHIYQKSATLQEALEEAAELVSDDATPEQWRLIQKARAALDIAAFLQVLTSIFARNSI